VSADGRQHSPVVVYFATQGTGSGDARRIRELLADLEPQPFDFRRDRKLRNIPALLRCAHGTRPDVVVMEGTGIAGGAAVVLARLLLGTPFIVSAGDAVAPYLAARWRAAAIPGWFYERLLCRLADGYIGWTPYLAGRALTFGAERAMTASHFSAHADRLLSRGEVRARLGLPDDALVAGIVGTLRWNHRRRYCYGLELVAAMRRVHRPDVAVVVIGGGTGVDRLRALAGDDLGRRIFIPGPVEPELVVSYLAAMDIGSLPQSLDRVGVFRYTTKLPEYLAARLPPATGATPASYDLMHEWAWRLPGAAPWDERYIAGLAELLERVQPADVTERRAAMPNVSAQFSAAVQRRHVAAFVRDVIEARRPAQPAATSSAYTLR
jgi:hypothetical protein